MSGLAGRLAGGLSDRLAWGIARLILPRMARSLAVLAAMALVGGCVEQTMTIKSDPPGALVYLNDQEVGRTPLKRDFIWYGNYQVEVRKEGYETLKMHKWITAPIYGWVPLDLFAQLQPFTLTDNHNLYFKLTPESPTAAEAEPLLSRAEELKGQLQSSRLTRKPASRPSTGPATRPATTKPSV